MPTTLKLPEELKRRIQPLARQSGKTPHAWMIDALEEQATRSELRERFVRDALEAAKEVDEGGPLYAAEDVHAYIRARAAGRPARRPPPAGRRRRH
ncbi:MAG: hypothetical protein HYZ28_28700 [Myxococcales bacterium]|nr:hypothetical protein [Myxococcales bacterium]